LSYLQQLRANDVLSSFISQGQLAAFGRQACMASTSLLPLKVVDTDCVVERSATNHTKIFRLASSSRPIQKNKQALFNDTTNRTRHNADYCLACDDGEGKDREANGHRSTADAKQLAKIERDDSGAITKILGDSCTEFTSLGRGSFGFRPPDEEGEWLRLLVWETCPTSPISVDRTRFPTAVSRKQEYFKYLPEAIGYLTPAVAKFGARRRSTESQKPAGELRCARRGRPAAF
jgi:hypothetical protein